MALKDISEKDLEKGRLIYNLAKKATIPGEKKSAEIQLEKFCKKHGITEDDLNPAANNRVLKAEHQDEVDLLLTIILSLNPYTRYKTVGLEVSCELDQEDYLELQSKYQYFVKLWRVEKSYCTGLFSQNTLHFSKPIIMLIQNGEIEI